MATTRRNPDESPRAEDDGRIDGTAPDQDGPHDVPDNEVIEQTLPTSSTREGKRDDWPGDTQLPR